MTRRNRKAKASDVRFFCVGSGRRSGFCRETRFVPRLEVIIVNEENYDENGEKEQRHGAFGVGGQSGDQKDGVERQGDADEGAAKGDAVFAADFATGFDDAIHSRRRRLPDGSSAPMAADSARGRGAWTAFFRVRVESDGGDARVIIASGIGVRGWVFVSHHRFEIYCLIVMILFVALICKNSDEVYCGKKRQFRWV